MIFPTPCLQHRNSLGLTTLDVFYRLENWNDFPVSDEETQVIYLNLMLYIEQRTM